VLYSKGPLELIIPKNTKTLLLTKEENP
jgi:hypothetical protein